MQRHMKKNVSYNSLWMKRWNIALCETSKIKGR